MAVFSKSWMRGFLSMWMGAFSKLWMPQRVGWAGIFDESASMRSARTSMCATVKNASPSYPLLVLCRVLAMPLLNIVNRAVSSKDFKSLPFLQKEKIFNIFLISCLLAVVAPASAFSWQDLWSTKDQQAQVLMEKGQYSHAKDTFERRDWQATAAYRAGDYERAVNLYKDMNDEHSFYNQGNALAHMGQYEQAIKAYDKALAIDPNHEDALHNRKEVEKLLKKDKQRQEQNKQDQNKQNQDKQDQNKQDQNTQDQNKLDQNKQDQNKQDQNKQDQNKQDQNKQDQNKQDQNKQDQNKQDQNKQDQNKQDQNKQDQNQPSKDADQNKHDKNKLNPQNQDKLKNQQNKNTVNKNPQDAAQSQADREKQQAKEQWLRLVPDDPGGLMREKFLRDHLRRQRGWY